MATFDDVRRIAMARPETEEILTWETDVAFRVQRKAFAIGGDGGDHGSIKASLATQPDLVFRDPETFAPAPYVGRYGWLSVDLRKLDTGELEGLLREAWRLTAPRKLVATVGD